MGQGLYILWRTRFVLVALETALTMRALNRCLTWDSRGLTLWITGVKEPEWGTFSHASRRAR
jgi:hypothetical protein